MPLFEYRCKSCASVSEHLVGVGSDNPALACPECGSKKLDRMISLVSVNRGAEPAMCCGGHVAGECEGACEHSAAFN